MYKVKKHIGIRIFFLALFLSYFTDITFFTHSHIIHGVTIVHSHFSCTDNTSSKEHPAEHSHSQNALTLISQVTAWAAVVPSIPEFTATYLTKIVTFSEEISFSAEQTLPTHFYLRGPPAKSAL